MIVKAFLAIVEVEFAVYGSPGLRFIRRTLASRTFRFCVIGDEADRQVCCAGVSVVFRKYPSQSNYIAPFSLGLRSY